MQLARFLLAFFEAGAVKYQAGQHYALGEETERCIAAGTAELVDAPADPQAALAAEDKAVRRATRAAAEAVDAKLQADAALAATQLAPAELVQTPAPGAEPAPAAAPAA